MQVRAGIKNRRSDSIVLPRIYFILQAVILILGTYIVSIALLSLGMNEVLVYAIMGIVNSYLIINYYFRCQYIMHRNRYKTKY